ncbi:hypothetical protein DM867_02880 [Halosegnis rubeus]|jgi:hypothetical protein|uniref:DUF8159 domain-containing protein n=1 Tax=Halosegnis rubeus TaxID=2212850 RepID=A0A5N5UD74_9EURY|nr:hypothetical protein [Halosegnis rubeus]KAB7516101.1 hypothetical protein DM867_02880 [Halosegnis rubeus]KAB7516685.1 hypothetical protein DMP03_04765 [Halosegnis rubeus]KAB7520184.1 hypothetical protein DP108_02750 [Halosegnis rubeus]
MTLTEDDVGAILESELAADGLYITHCEHHDGALHVGYESPGVNRQIPQSQVGTILRAFLALAGIETESSDGLSIPDAGGWDPEAVEVWAFDNVDSEDDRETKGHFEVHEGWFHALEAGHISETDFSTLVLSTLE